LVGFEGLDYLYSFQGRNEGNYDDNDDNGSIFNFQSYLLFETIASE
jgi:hypothetical protein